VQERVKSGAVPAKDPCSDPEYLRSTLSLERKPASELAPPFTGKTSRDEFSLHQVAVVRTPCAARIRVSNGSTFQFDSGIAIGVGGTRDGPVAEVMPSYVNLLSKAFVSGPHPSLKDAKFVMAQGLVQQERGTFIGLYQRKDASVLTAFYRCSPSTFVRHHELLESRLLFRSIYVFPAYHSQRSQVFALNVVSDKEAHVYEFLWEDEITHPYGQPEPKCTKGEAG
jgi:hypothetical protein